MLRQRRCRGRLGFDPPNLEQGLELRGERLQPCPRVSGPRSPAPGWRCLPRGQGQGTEPSPLSGEGLAGGSPASAQTRACLFVPDSLMALSDHRFS